MKSECVATVICLSPALESCVRKATELLRMCDDQHCFRFEFGGLSEALKQSRSEAPHSWSLLQDVLVGERQRRRCENLIAVLDQPIQNNWFSRTAYGKNVAWITTSDWEFYSDVPEATFLAYETVSNLLLMLVAQRPEDEGWLMREVIHTQETRECVSDMCAYKPDISRKIRSGGICPDCRRVLGTRLGEQRLEAALKLLKVVGSAAAAEAPGTLAPISARQLASRSCDVLNHRRHEAVRELSQLHTGMTGTHQLLAQAHELVAGLRRRRGELMKRQEERKAGQPGARTGDKTEPEELLELKAIEEQLSKAEAEIIQLREREDGLKANERRLARAASDRKEMISMLWEAGPGQGKARRAQVLGSTAILCFESELGEELDWQNLRLPNEIERGYPFPIAYCFRALRAELRPLDRWMRLYDLYKLVVRYTTFVLLADRAARGITCPPRLGELIQKLNYGLDGDWGKACAGLMRLSSGRKARNSAVFGFLDSLDAQQISDMESLSIGGMEDISRSIVRERNSKQGHGYKQDAVAYQKVFDQHLPGMKRWLAALAPLAECPLIRPVELLKHCDGECVFVSKILVGADTIFLPYKMHSTQLPETVCQLLSPDGERRLVLHPWLHLDRCTQCQREMVFLYDAVYVVGDKAVAKLCEYPSNHDQERPDLTRKVQQSLAAG
jgi:hypothetical protein